MLQVKNVVKKFSGPSGDVVAVNNVNVKISKGQFASIIGKSGSGKSTLLSLLGALDKPTSGEILVNGKDIAKMRAKTLTRYRCQQIGFVFQNYNLIPNLTALENVMLPMEFAGVPAKKRKDRAARLLEQVGIDEVKQKRKPGRLSGGEQQRVAIARSLANKPSVIFADEPTGNLDEQTGKMIFDLLHSLARTEQTTIVAVTHDLSIAGKTDVTYTLKDGTII